MAGGISVTGFKPVHKNTLRGFVSVTYGSLTLHDCPVHVHTSGRAWIGLPGKPQLDSEGRQKRDVNGKPAYTPFAEWANREVSDRFSLEVIEQLRQRYPNALEADP
jgi:hypothetical protein